MLAVCLPLALLQCQFSTLGKKEWELFRAQWLKEGLAWGGCAILVFDGCLAYVINVLSLATNKKVGPLSMVVVGNLKQAFAVCIGLFMSHSFPSLLHLVGILMTLSGSAWYSIAWMDLSKKRKRPHQ